MRAVWLALLLGCCVVHASARAEERPANTVDEEERQARSYFAIGAGHFSVGEYEAAISAFQSGYKHKPLAMFLFNIAQAARKGGRLDMARAYYKQYIEQEPAHETPTFVEAQVQARELSRRLVLETAPSSAPPTAVVIASGPPVERSATRPPLWKRGWVWGVVAGVAAVAGAAVGLGVGLTAQPSPPAASLGKFAFPN
jgi:tetratricopeptide (TPR) repeat protein